MPCYDSRDSADAVRASARAGFRHNSDVAEMLCDLMKRLDPTQIAALPLATQLWWVEHQKRDADKATSISN